MTQRQQRVADLVHQQLAELFKKKKFLMLAYQKFC